MVNGDQPDLLEGSVLRREFGAGLTAQEALEQEVEQAIDEELQEESQEEIDFGPTAQTEPERERQRQQAGQQEQVQRQQERERQAQQQELTELEQFAIQEGVAPPRTREQRQILRQVREIREFEEGGFTPSEREAVELGQQEIQVAGALDDIEAQQELIRSAEPGTEIIFETETGETRPIHIEEVREEELQRLESQELRARAALGDLETGQEILREQASIESLRGTELSTRFFTGIGAEAVVAAETLFFEPSLTASVPQIDVAREVAEAFGGEAPDPRAEREAFQEILPELTEVQRRFGIAEERIEAATPQPLEEALAGSGVDIFERIPGGGVVSPFFEEEITQITGRVPEFVAEEIPEKQTELATGSLIIAEAATEPERLFEDIVVGGPETVRRAREDPVEFGVGELAVDVGLDLITGGGIVMAQPQVEATVTRFFENFETPGAARTRAGQARLVPPQRVREQQQDIITEPEFNIPVQTELEITELFPQEAQTQAQLEQLLTGTEQIQVLETEQLQPTRQEQAVEQAFTQEQAQPQLQSQQQARLQLQAQEQTQLQTQLQAQEQATLQALLEPQPQPQPRVQGLTFPPGELFTDQDFDTLFVGGQEETDFTTSLVGEFFEIEETEELTEFTGLEPRRRRRASRSTTRSVERQLEDLL